MIIMYSMILTNHSKFHLNLWKKHGQPLNPNYYSNKTCACCGTYHGFCNLKYNYWADMEEYEIYPEDISDFHCDGCKCCKTDNCLDSETFIFEGQNPKVDCPQFQSCDFCQGTGVYSNKLIEYLGTVYYDEFIANYQEYDIFDIDLARKYYWNRHIPSNKTLECVFDTYLSDNTTCPFCHNSKKLEDPIETFIVAQISNAMMEYGLFETVSAGFDALNVWRNMKYGKRLFGSDFRRYDESINSIGK